MPSLGLLEKLAALCRELGDPTFEDAVSAAEGTELLDRLRRALREGRSPYPESELDELNRMLEQAEGLGLYPAARRGYESLPGAAGAAGGAQWWSCPAGRCAGHGLVRRGQPTPVCAVTGDELAARPLVS